jgi:tetratricopeptide (TPR) repeat protein
MPDNGKRIVEDDAREDAIKQAMRRGNFDQAERLCLQWIAEVAELGDQHWIPFAQMTLAELALDRRDYDEAERLIRNYLKTAHEFGNRHEVAVAQGKLAIVARHRRDYDLARQLLNQAMATMQEMGNRHQFAILQTQLAALMTRLGDAGQAEQLLKQAVATMQDYDDVEQAAIVKSRLAELAAVRGDNDEAERRLKESIASHKAIGDLVGETTDTYNLAGILQRIGRMEEAVKLMEHVVEIDEAINHPDLEKDRRVLVQYRAELTGETPEIEWGNPLDQLADDTIEVLTRHKDQRGEFFNYLQQFKVDAQKFNDAPMVALVEAVIKLLLGDAIESIQPELEGSYAACWDRIVQGIENPPEQPNTLDLIAANTIAVMTEHKSRREEWFDAMQQLKTQAQGYKDAPMVALAEAVIKLLQGDAIESIQPELEGSCAACWDRIVQGIENPPPE